MFLGRRLYREPTDCRGMNISELQDRFGLPSVLSFDMYQGLARPNVTTRDAQATMYLQGAT